MPPLAHPAARGMRAGPGRPPLLSPLHPPSPPREQQHRQVSGGRRGGARSERSALRDPPLRGGTLLRALDDAESRAGAGGVWGNRRGTVIGETAPSPRRGKGEGQSVKYRDESAIFALREPVVDSSPAAAAAAAAVANEANEPIISAISLLLAREEATAPRPSPRYSRPFPLFLCFSFAKSPEEGPAAQRWVPQGVQAIHAPLRRPNDTCTCCCSRGATGGCQGDSRGATPPASP